MKWCAVWILARLVLGVAALNLEYLDPAKLQTRASPGEQQRAAARVIAGYMDNVTVHVDSALFEDSKDVFEIESAGSRLSIRASSGVAALWGFHHYLKRYCGAHVGWQVRQLRLPRPLPAARERVVANDRFRYYQNVCTASYSFVWWGAAEWRDHVHWMAMNGINLALAPVAQEAAWKRIYRRVGMTGEEIDEHFTGPAFLSWLRMGNVRGWGGPLSDAWHDGQKPLQDDITDYMFRLGIVPVYPAFNGHVPKAFARIYPEKIFYNVSANNRSWNGFSEEYCCGLFLDPLDPLFVDIGKLFLEEITIDTNMSHIYTVDPFNEVNIKPWTTSLVEATAKAIFSSLTQIDEEAVWLMQNWMFIHDPIMWPRNRVRSMLTSVPEGRMLVLDLQSEQWPQFNLYDMYFGQPFIWCMLHNFGGTLGMFGSMPIINREVHVARSSVGSTMIGIGLTPEGINQNYVVYELMLEMAWRKEPVPDLDDWVAAYAERRYACNVTAKAWKYLLKSVYSFDGLNKIRGKYVITRRPSFKIRPWAWYKSRDLFEALRIFVFAQKERCHKPSIDHDLVDLTRQALQYRAEQLYVNLQIDRFSNTFVFNASVNRYLDAMNDMERILSTNSDFSVFNWLESANRSSSNVGEQFLYQVNARNQITLWGPNGEISDYACKQWAELFHHYYIPRWRMFLSAALDAKHRKEVFMESMTQTAVRALVEEKFLYVDIEHLEPDADTWTLAEELYKKWAYVPGLNDLPIIRGSK